MDATQNDLDMISSKSPMIKAHHQDKVPISQAVDKNGLEKLEPSSDTQQSMTRTNTSLTVYLFLCSTFIFVEMAKQVTTYALRYHHGGKYPMTQTSLVAIVEFIKLSVVSILFVSKKKLDRTYANEQLTFSWKFVVPSVIYAFNNNLYYYALNIVAPPIWMVIIQSRVVITALSYKFIFKRQVTAVQWLGTVFITIAVITNELPNLFGNDHISIPVSAIFLSLLSACTSCAAAIYTEMLLKNTKCTFLVQQIQLYFFGFIVSISIHLIGSKGANPFQCDNCVEVIMVLLLGCLFLNSVGGMVVAAVIKLLDNIVKIYTSAIANILTAILCTILFPKSFEFNMIFLISLITLFIGIYLYEVKKIPEMFKSKRNEGSRVVSA